MISLLYTSLPPSPFLSLLPLSSPSRQSSYFVKCHPFIPTKHVASYRSDLRPGVTMPKHREIKADERKATPQKGREDTPPKHQRHQAQTYGMHLDSFERSEPHFLS